MADWSPWNAGAVEGIRCRRAKGAAFPAERNRERPPLRSRTTWGAHPNQMVGKQTVVPTGALALGGQGNIEFALIEQRSQRSGAAGDQSHQHIGPPTSKLAKHRRHAGNDVVRHAESDLPAERAPAHVVENLVIQRNQASRAAHEPLAVRRKARSVRLALEQLDLQERFEPEDPLADCGLRKMNDLGGAGHAPRLRYCDERSQQTHIDVACCRHSERTLIVVSNNIRFRFRRPVSDHPGSRCKAGVERVPIAIGQVEAIFRYPVKSMRGELLDAATLGWHGLEGDRRLAFRRLGARGGFPWLTAGKLPDLILFAPQRRGEGDREALPTHVITPEGEEMPLFGEALAAEILRRYGAPVEMMQFKHGIFDDATISVITSNTVREICQLAGTPADVRRFRPNIVVRSTLAIPFEEDEWLGGVLTFGEASDAPAIAVTMRDVRCAMVNIDPENGRPAPDVLKAVVGANENNAGIYATVTRTGHLTVGQTIFLHR